MTITRTTATTLNPAQHPPPLKKPSTTVLNHHHNDNPHLNLNHQIGARGGLGVQELARSWPSSSTLMSMDLNGVRKMSRGLG